MTHVATRRWTQQSSCNTVCNARRLCAPEIQIGGGGAHSGQRIDVQDFMIISVGAKSYPECLEMSFNVYHRAGELMKKRGRLAGLADEGGYWRLFDSNEQVFEFLVEAID